MPTFKDRRDSAYSCDALNGSDLEVTHVFSLKAGLTHINAGDAVDTELSEVWKWLPSPDNCGSPVVAFLRGYEFASLVPVECHSFPVLGIHLPESMHEEAASLANGQLVSVNLISADLKRSQTHLTLRGRSHALELGISHILREFLAAVGEVQELILVVRCGETEQIRYYPNNQEWLERFWLTNTVANSYEPSLLFSSDKITEADAKEVEHSDADYNAWLYDDYSAQAVRRRFADDTPTGKRPVIEGQIVWNVIMYQVRPHIMGDRDIFF
jgi:hypothetical protein